MNKTKRGGTESGGLVVAVTGGRGFLGGVIVSELLRGALGAAHGESHGLKIREIRVLDLQPVAEQPVQENVGGVLVRAMRVDVCDAGAVCGAVRGAHAVVHTAAAVDVWGRMADADIHRVNVGGTRTLLQACVQERVQVLVFTSSMEVVGPNAKGEPFYRGNEETEYTRSHAVAYPASKAEAERLVLRANNTALGGGGRLRTVSLRPLGIYGEGHDVLREYYRRAGGRGGWFLRSTPHHVEHGRVYVGNVAWMHVLALKALWEAPRGVEGEAFFCYDDSPRLSYEDFNTEILSLCGIRMLGGLNPIIPTSVIRLMGVLNDLIRGALSLLGIRYCPLLTRYTAAMALTTFSVDTDKAARAFGYAPLYSWEAARDRTAAWVGSLGLARGGR